MRRSRRFVALSVLALLTVCVGARPAPSRSPALEPLPDRLSDQAFWQLSVDVSEPGGYFRSDNLVSNEHTYQFVLPALAAQAKPGGVYLGVAPDQNFTYILATKARMAFIVDIRRGNLLEHLLYKALIELSPTRAAFVSRLFSKPAPKGLAADVSVDDLFAAFAGIATQQELYGRTLAAVRAQLVEHHGFRLTPEDMAQLEEIYFAFFWDGPGLRYSTAGGRGGAFRNNFPSYEDLAVARDPAGVPRGYLASEAQFRTLRSLQERNLIVPVVGNFAGPKALRAVGAWVRQRGGVISAFYVSNVEQYLFQDGLFEPFARNVATLPVDEGSTFIRSVSSRFGYAGRGPLGPDGRASALYPIQAFLRDFRGGGLDSYYEVNRRSR